MKEPHFRANVLAIIRVQLVNVSCKGCSASLEIRLQTLEMFSILVLSIMKYLES